MMKITGLQRWGFIIVLISMFGCLSEPEYSDIPSIQFENLRLVDKTDSADRLYITFSIEDGDGNFGLSSDEQSEEFAPYFYVVYHKSGTTYPLIRYADSTIVPPFYLTTSSGGLTNYDVEEIPELNCTDWVELEYIDSLTTSVDTFWVVRNKYYGNLFIDYYKKRNGEFYLTSLAEEFGIDDCNELNLDYRVPYFTKGNQVPLLGTYTYDFASNGLKLFLAEDTFKIRMYVVDRDLNESNVVESPEYTIFDILEEQ